MILVHDLSYRALLRSPRRRWIVSAHDFVQATHRAGESLALPLSRFILWNRRCGVGPNNVKVSEIRRLRHIMVAADEEQSPLP